MNIFKNPNHANDPAANRTLILCLTIVVAVFIGFILFCSPFRANAAGPAEASTAAPEQNEQLLAENERLTAEAASLSAALQAAEEERDSLLSQLNAVQVESAQFKSELEALRNANATAYVMRFRVERNIQFPKDSEILYFTRVVDEETFNRWDNGDILAEDISFLTLPNDGILHEWVLIMEEKYVTTTESNLE